MESNEPEGVSSGEASQDTSLGPKAASLDPDSLSLSRCDSLLDRLIEKVGLGKEDPSCQATGKEKKEEEGEIAKGEQKKNKVVEERQEEEETETAKGELDKNKKVVGDEKEVAKEEKSIKVVGDKKQEKIIEEKKEEEDVEEKKLEEANGGKKEKETGGEKIQTFVKEKKETEVGEKKQEKFIKEKKEEEVGEKISTDKEQEKTIGGKNKEKVAGEEKQEKVIGGKNKEEVAGEKKQEKVIGGKSKEKVAGEEKEENAVVGKNKEKVAGEEKQENAVGGKNKEKVAGEEKQENAFGGKSKEKVTGEEKQENVISGKNKQELVGGKDEKEAVGEKKEEEALEKENEGKGISKNTEEETGGGKNKKESIGEKKDEDEAVGEKNDNGEDETMAEKKDEAAIVESKQIPKDVTVGKPSTPRHLFHLSDNMKKGLSLLAYPSKAPTRKKGITSSRSTSNFRITIGEALEKVQDVKEKKLSSSTSNPAQSLDHITNTSRSEPSNLPTNVEGQSGDVNVSKKESEVGRVSVVDLSTLMGEKENTLQTESFQSENMSTESSSNDSLATTSSEGVRPPLAGKAKPTTTSRLKLTTRMEGLLKFTFTHEHFPASVHMARLAKMMGIQWSQIRNWFTDRRVENKRAGIFPRDRVLLFCSYCDLNLKSETEQKNHLFSIAHVKNILGPEYAGPTPSSESIRWKQLPQGVNAISKNSGGKILAVGYHQAKDKNDSGGKAKLVETSSSNQMDTSVSKENVSHSEKLQRLWTNSVLLQDKMEKDLSKSTAKRGRGKYRGFNGHRQMEMLKNSTDSPEVSSGEEKGTMRLTDNNHQSSGVIVEKMLIGNRGISALMTDNASSSVPNSPNHYSGDPCSSSGGDNSKSKDVSTTDELESDILYRISRRGKTIPSITVRSERKLSTSGINEKTASASNSAEMVSPITVNYDTGATRARKRIANTESAYTKDSQESMNTSCEDSDIIDETTIKEEPLSDEGPCNSSNTSNSSSNYHSIPKDTHREHQLIKIENPMFQNLASRPSTSSQRWIPYRTQHSGSNTHKGHTNSTTAKMYSSRYKSQEASTGSRGRPRSSGIKRGMSGRRSPQVATPSPRTSTRLRSLNEESIMLGYQCPTCHKIFQTEWLMIKHCLTHLKYQCYICDQMFPNEVTLKYHLIDHLAGAYEDEKYYCQFSCKTCHSLKCECYIPTYCKPRELPKKFPQPQKARRSKKTFITRPNSGPNDHLRVNLSQYRKLVHRSAPVIKGKTISSVSQKPSTLSVNNSSPLKQSKQLEEVTNSTVVETKTENHTNRDTEPQPHTTTAHNSVSKEATPGQSNSPSVSVQSVSGAQATQMDEDTEAPVPVPTKKHATRKKPAPKLSNNFVYKDADYYYMCEICDASFLSKVELNEHMFFHRLKSRSRRGEKRGQNFEEENEVLKKMKTDEPLSKIDVETITVGGFERFKCPMCKGHFATITDLNRHKTQAHSENVSPQIKELLQCVYCDKLYRRDRELRRHLKHDCVYAPKSLKECLTPGVSLELASNGPHYRIVKKNVVSQYLNEPSSSKASGKVSKRGPITCKYCQMVTKREAEMKRHVWKYCSMIPKDVIMQFKKGASLKDLGFVFGAKGETLKISKSESCKDDVDPDLCDDSSVQEMDDDTTPQQQQEEQQQPADLPTTPTTTDSPKHSGSPSPTSTPNKSPSQSQISLVPISSLLSSPATQSSSVSSVKSLPSPVMSIPVVPPTSIGTKSRHPLVCGYCGIWYFREQAILKHMKERCIRLPPYEKELLQNGAQLYNVSQEKSVCVSLAPGSVATYKMVEVPEHKRQNLTLPPIDIEFNKDIKMISSEIHESLESKAADGTKGLTTCEPSTSNASTKGSGTPTTPLESDIMPATPVKSPGIQTTPVKTSDVEATPVKTPQGKGTPTKSIRKETTSNESPGKDGISVQAEEETTPVSLAGKENTPVTSPPEATIPINTPVKGPVKEGTPVRSQGKGSTPVKSQGKRRTPVKSPEKGSTPAKSPGKETTPVKSQEQKNTPVKSKGKLSTPVTSLNSQTSTPVASSLGAKTTLSLESVVSPISSSETSTTTKPTPGKPKKKTGKFPVKLNRGPRCRRCYEHFETQDAVLAHSSVHHGPKKGMYKCKLCLAKIPKYKELREHIWGHTNETPYRCHLCFEMYRWSDTLIEHFQKEHGYNMATERNLYKWLPKRNGKYREIKSPNKNCEETLDDVDASLDSLAEVMVITDSDICTEKKDTKPKNEIVPKVEEKSVIDNSDLSEKAKSEGSVADADPVEDLKELKSDAKGKGSGVGEVKQQDKQKAPQNVKEQTTLRLRKCRLKKNEVKGKKLSIENNNDSNSSSSEVGKDASASGKKVEKSVGQKKGKESKDTSIAESEKDTSVEDGYTENGEGLLSNLDNLESVIETVHLTDTHLS
ncbi:hypothetical protein Pmani_024330 [Petrolisthes manimaculis]|uniref:Uncharacterized protein n=1 Tax=Petrolisthes manimaculis TaxID=1843537 RepID=A0AAE1P7R5_9EUCA|nr:hypothetical protein Pmani_024330 [Petrolisthes manimaculis]